MIAILVISLFGIAIGQSCVEYSYEGEYGPDNWPKYCEQCGGNNQSPIDIDYNYVDYEDLGEIEFINYSTPISNVTIVNLNGRTIELLPPSDARILITGGGLNGIYRLTQCHFHWGEHNYVGSEHAIGGRFYPLELHCVHINEKYSSEEEALRNSDGLAVLAVFFKLSHSFYLYNSYFNPTLERITQEITLVRHPNQNSTLPFNLRFSEIIPEDTSYYYRYNGSLTTPGCSEAVIWTIFSHVLHVTPEQLDRFRSAVTSKPGETEQQLLRNYRPLQPVNGRRIITTDYWEWIFSFIYSLFW